jgi:hypothetical protein
VRSLTSPAACIDQLPRGTSENSSPRFASRGGNCRLGFTSARTKNRARLAALARSAELTFSATDSLRILPSARVLVRSAALLRALLLLMHSGMPGTRTKAKPLTCIRSCTRTVRSMKECPHSGLSLTPEMPPHINSWMRYACRMPKGKTANDKGLPLGRKAEPRKTRKDGLAIVNVPKDKPGNTKLDQGWMSRHADELTEVEESDEVPFGVRYRWSGQAPMVAGEFLTGDDERHERPCVGRAFIRDGEGRKIIDSEGLLLTRPCAKPPMAGAVACGSHGGLTPGSLAAAKTRLLASADAVVGRLIYIALHPGTLDEVAIRAINSILDRAGIRAGSEIDVKTPEWQQMLKEMFEKEGQ